MKYDVRLSNNETYILVRPKEPTEWQGIVECLSEAATTAKAHGLRGYLLDLRNIPSGFSLAEHYKIAHHEGRKMGFVPGSRIALLVDVGDHSRDFVEIVVNNAGFNCARFEEEPAAIAWLEEGAT